MKIGILTFHWATNYGAVLQAYALQNYLRKKGYDVYIINYRPKQYKKSLFKCFINLRFLLFPTLIKEYLKEQKLEVFRKENLNETIEYESLSQLKNNPPLMDVYICGSDQIWNPHFTTKGENNKSTSTYFLDFGESDIKRIAYSVSFGCEKYPKEAANVAMKYLPNFTNISVRENSGISIIKKLGYNNIVKLPDPTILLCKQEYDFLTRNENNGKNIFVYMLRNENINKKKILSHFEKGYKLKLCDRKYSIYSIENWLSNIKNASFVITNSFHGMVFSIIFHVPFVVIKAKGNSAGMNDRFFSLLSEIGLGNRIISDSNNFDSLVGSTINWQNIDKELKTFRDATNIFFDNILN
jgi:exopolysaccharide biosynthesis predicted pyruvyltransferase EpsI